MDLSCYSELFRMAVERHEQEASSAEMIAGMEMYIQQLKMDYKAVDGKYQALLKYVLLFLSDFLFLF